MGCYGHYELFVSDSPRRSLWRFDLQRCLSTWLVWSDPFERCGIACVVLVRRKLNASVVCRTSSLAFRDRRRWSNTSQILVLGLPEVSYQGAMHQWRISAHRTLGARTRAQENAKAFGAHAAGIATMSADRRTSLRHPRGVDGSDTFIDQDAASRAHRNELACVGLLIKRLIRSFGAQRVIRAINT